MALMSLAACTGPAVVTTDDAGPPASASPTAAPPPLNSANLVNAFQFGAPVDGFTQAGCLEAFSQVHRGSPFMRGMTYQRVMLRRSRSTVGMCALNGSAGRWGSSMA